MKRISFLIVIFVVLIALSGCQVVNVNLTAEQSKENFEVYKEQLNTLLKPYDLVLNEKQTEVTEHTAFRSFYVNIDENTEISLYLKNLTGREEFELRYENGSNKEIDTALFTGFVNIISGVEITKEHCDTFLSAPEEKYLPSKYGRNNKSAGTKICKFEAIRLKVDLFEEWGLDYTLNNDDTETLTFSGLTKKGTVVA